LIKSETRIEKCHGKIYLGWKNIIQNPWPLIFKLKTKIYIHVEKNKGKENN